MEYGLEIPSHIDKLFTRLAKRNRKQLEIILKKLQEVRRNPTHYKPLRGDLRGAYRVHIDKSFVLVYEIDERRKIVRVLDYGHHDEVY